VSSTVLNRREEREKKGKIRRYYSIRVHFSREIYNCAPGKQTIMSSVAILPTSFDRRTSATASDEDFYVRYYVGHKGKFGHEFLEFEFRPDGKLRYANNSNYKNDTMIRKEVFVNRLVMDVLR
jgi:hypothetical protein